MYTFVSIVQYVAANTAVQGAYMPQYAHMQTTTVPVEVSAAVPLAYEEYIVSNDLGNNFTLSSRKMVHSHKWTHLAIIPRTPTNKPSSTMVTHLVVGRNNCLQMRRTLRVHHCFAQVLQIVSLHL